jgi:UrcA family protein
MGEAPGRGPTGDEFLMPMSGTGACGQRSDYLACLRGDANGPPGELEMTCKTLLVTAAALCMVAGGARAESRPSMTLKVSDLNLSSPKDVQRLYDRLYDAASLVCGGGPLVTFIPFPNTDFMACRDATLDAALSQFHSPLVGALRRPVRTPD